MVVPGDWAGQQCKQGIDAQRDDRCLYPEQRELEWNAWQALMGNSYLWWTILALLVMTIRLALYRGKTSDKTPVSEASSEA